MSNSVVMSAETLRSDRAAGAGWRRVRFVLREILLALHSSRRKMARRIVRNSRSGRMD